MIMKDKKIIAVAMVITGFIFVIWFSVLFTPAIGGGLPVMLLKLQETFSHPFRLTWCANTWKFMIVACAGYVLTVTVYSLTKPNYRRREEYGSAAWGDIKQINKKYRQKPEYSNKILTQHIRIGYDGKRHRRNLNTLVVGGSGAGKTRFYAKPNIMQANTSFVLLDPKGGATRS